MMYLPRSTEWLFSFTNVRLKIFVLRWHLNVSFLLFGFFILDLRCHFDILIKTWKFITDYSSLRLLKILNSPITPCLWVNEWINYPPGFPHEKIAVKLLTYLTFDRSFFFWQNLESSRLMNIGQLLKNLPFCLVVHNLRRKFNIE